jgi:alpha/beta superfamily hydrolase
MGLGNSGPAATTLRSVDLFGSAGRLEALVNEGAPGATFAALVCHPHPLGGGTFNNKVVYHAMKAMNDPEWGLGWPVLRFNFRGVGLSQGVYDGEAESEDVLAAMEWLDEEFKLPLVVVGFSFGAAMAVKACCGRGASGFIDANVRALGLIGLPTQADGRRFHYKSLQSCIIPKLFLSGDSDSFAPAAELAQVAAAAAEPRHLALIPLADHFFTGQLEPMKQALCSWLKEQLL